MKSRLKGSERQDSKVGLDDVTSEEDSNPQNRE